MSANVDSMFSVRQVPWHREGVILGDYPGSWEEARKYAGLEWEPTEAEVWVQKGFTTEEQPVYELHGMSDGGEPLYRQASINQIEVPNFEINPGHKHIVRSDNQAILSVNAKNYTLITHADMGGIVEAILDQPNIKWETAGSLSGGKAVWVLVQLDEPITLPGDDTLTYPYLAVTNRHDGTGACTLRSTAIRIVCQNTFNASEMEGERTGAVYSFRHSTKWRERVEEAKEAITGARTELVRYRDLATELLGHPITKGQRELFITTFIPAPPAGLVTDRVMGNIEEARGKLRDIFSSPTTAGVADTAYGLVQAAGEYLDHVRTARSWETRLNRTIMRPEPLKAKALKLVRELVNV